MQDKLIPLVSIIIPTYNREEIIKNTLDSIHSQSYTNWECIVVDDYSTDDTNKIIKEYVDNDNRFYSLKNNKDKGAQGARNTGLLKANGEYISFFDSDNLMHKDRLSKQVKFFENNPHCDVCTCYSHLLNDNSEITGTFTWITKGNILKSILEGST